MSRGQPLPLQVRGLVDGLRTFAADLSGAKDPASVAAARVLMRAMRKQVRTKAANLRTSLKSKVGNRKPVPRVYGTASAPGESPRSLTGRLARSVGTEIVGGIRRVGFSNFVARLLEEGVDTSAKITPSGREIGTLRNARIGRLRKGQIGPQFLRSLRRRKAGNANRTLRIARRPFMEKALAEALPKMEGEAVSALQSRSLKGPALT